MCQVRELADVMKRFQVEVRKNDGSNYLRSRLPGIRGVLHRYLRDLPIPWTGISLFGDNSALDEASDLLDKLRWCLCRVFMPSGTVYAEFVTFRPYDRRILPTL